ncbi:MAG: bifunctional heptose 7-phosphate kinase/heptose 1-phosphate adenyltransferase [Planctomycetaceae bacterium]
MKTFTPQQMTADRLSELIERFPSRRIAVIGDFFLDKYLDTDPRIIESSVETGRHAHQVVQIRRAPGVAGTVVNNLASLGTGTIYTLGAIGDDGEAFDLRRCLTQLGCRVEGLLQFDSLMTPQYLKPRNITDPSLKGEHDRYDTKNRRPMPAEIGERVLAALDKVLPELDAVIISDQVEYDDCGIITAAVRHGLSERAQRHPRVIFWVDSRTHIKHFRHVHIKPNQFEAVDFPAPKPEDRISLEQIEQSLPQLAADARAPVCITLGERGMCVSDPVPTLVPGVRVPPLIDSTGAGDSATAGCVLALAAGANLAEGALVGNLVASITVQQLAVTGTAKPSELIPRLQMWKEQQS